MSRLVLLERVGRFSVFALKRRVRAFCPANDFSFQNMISGASQMDGAILVVSASSGAMPQTREHVLLARQVGIQNLVVFLNKCDLVSDPELLEFVEMEVKEILDEYKFDGEGTPFVRGSAVNALEGKTDEYGVGAIDELMAACDAPLPHPCSSS